jgi:hypothetical protein
MAPQVSPPPSAACGPGDAAEVAGHWAGLGAEVVDGAVGQGAQGEAEDAEAGVDWEGGGGAVVVAVEVVVVELAVELLLALLLLLLLAFSSSSSSSLLWLLLAVVVAAAGRSPLAAAMAISWATTSPKRSPRSRSTFPTASTLGNPLRSASSTVRTAKNIYFLVYCDADVKKN